MPPPFTGLRRGGCASKWSKRCSFPVGALFALFSCRETEIDTFVGRSGSESTQIGAARQPRLLENSGRRSDLRGTLEDKSAFVPSAISSIPMQIFCVVVQPGPAVFATAFMERRVKRTRRLDNRDSSLLPSERASERSLVGPCARLSRRFGRSRSHVCHIVRTNATA